MYKLARIGDVRKLQYSKEFRVKLTVRHADCATNAINAVAMFLNCPSNLTIKYAVKLSAGYWAVGLM